MPTDNPRIYVTLKPLQFSDIEKLAAKFGKSKSSVCQAIIAAFFEKRKKATVPTNADRIFDKV